MDFEQLYNTYFMQVYSYVITLAKNSDEAEEITQKAFFKAFTAKKAFSGGSSPQRGCKKSGEAAYCPFRFLFGHRKGNRVWDKVPLLLLKSKKTT